MKLYKITRFNQKGFSHHIILPLLVIALITLAGVRVMNSSHAATIQSVNSAAIGTATQASKPLSIHVKGGKLKNGSGKTIRLLGVDASGTEAGCVNVNGGKVTQGVPISQANANAIASWKINAVRVPLNEDCWLGINGISINGESSAASAVTYQQAIESWVADLNNAGIYVILVLHWNAPGTMQADQSNQEWPMADEDHAPAFWTSVASTFQKNPAVIFDLFNEPSLGNQGPTMSATGASVPPWSCWLNGCVTTNTAVSPSVTYSTAGMQQLVNTVRATGASQPIMLGGLDWSGDPCGYFSWQRYGSTAACPELANLPNDTNKQLIVGFHNYLSSNCSTNTCWDNYWNGELNPIKAANIPMVTGEFGEADCTDSFMNTYMSWADTQKESYLAWSWSTYSGPQPPSCVASPNSSDWVNYSLLNDYTGTPSTVIPQGRYYMNHLAKVSPY